MPRVSTKQRPRRRPHRPVLSCLGGLAALCVAGPTHALVGSHGPSLGTFDERASSLGLLPTVMRAGSRSLDVLTYHTAYSSTTGRISSQFSVHGLRLVEAGGRAGYGVSAGAVTMVTLPPSRRYDNGVPTSTLRIWTGLVPSGVFGAIYGNIWIPFTLGAAWTASPTPWLSITPWAEIAAGLDAAAEVQETKANLDTAGDDVVLSEEKVRDILKDAIRWNVGFGFGWRAGVEVAAHFGDRFDFAVLAGGARLGNEVGWMARVALIFRWDDIVPGVLPDACRVPREPTPALPLPRGGTQTAT